MKTEKTNRFGTTFLRDFFFSSSSSAGKWNVTNWSVRSHITFKQLSFSLIMKNVWKSVNNKMSTSLFSISLEKMAKWYCHSKFPARNILTHFVVVDMICVREHQEQCSNVSIFMWAIDISPTNRQTNAYATITNEQFYYCRPFFAFSRSLSLPLCFLFQQNCMVFESRLIIYFIEYGAFDVERELRKFSFPFSVSSIISISF